MDVTQLLLGVLSSGGLAIIYLVVQAIIKWLSGRAQSERMRNVDMHTQRDDALREIDELRVELGYVYDSLNEANEYAAQLRRQLIELGEKPVIDFRKKL